MYDRKGRGERGRQGKWRSRSEGGNEERENTTAKRKGWKGREGKKGKKGKESTTGIEREGKSYKVEKGRKKG